MMSVNEDSSLEGNEVETKDDQQGNSLNQPTQFQRDQHNDLLLDVLDKAMDVLDKSSYYGINDLDNELGIPVEGETIDPRTLISRSHFGHKK